MLRRSIIGWVIRQMPPSLRRKRSASSSGSSPTTSPSGMVTAASITTLVSRAERPTFDIRQDHAAVGAGEGIHPDIAEQQRFAQRGAGDDATARHQRRYRLSAPPFEVVDEFGWRGQFGIGPDRPVAVVDVEFRGHAGEVDVGGPIGVERADVAPIGGRLLFRAHAGIGEPMRDRLAVLDDVGDQVLAEIVARSSGRRRPRASRSNRNLVSKT